MLVLFMVQVLQLQRKKIPLFHLDYNNTWMTHLRQAFHCAQ